MNIDFLNRYVLIKRGKKPNIFYEKLAEYYSLGDEYVKQQVLLVVSFLFRLGNWKDYYYLLIYANKELENHIYNFLIDELKLQDKIRQGNISKWLPREKSKFDIRLKFVDEFCSRMYPNVSNKFTRRKMYRKYISDLCRDMNLLTFNIGNFTGSYDKIPLRTLLKYSERLDQNGIQALENKLNNLSLFKIGYLIVKRKYSSKIFIKVFNNNLERYKLYLINRNLYYPDKMPVLDTSIKMAPCLYKAYMVLLVNGYNRIKINFRSPYFVEFIHNMDLFEKIDLLIANIMPSDQIYQETNQFIITNNYTVPTLESNSYWIIEETTKVIKTNQELINNIFMIYPKKKPFGWFDMLIIIYLLLAGYFLFYTI